MHWSALQYVIHAFTERDIVEGAWNLKVSRLADALTLNYHNHLAHHRHPQLPWLYLPKFVEPDDRRPSAWRIYFRLWRGGTQPAPPMGGPATLPPP